MSRIDWALPVQVKETRFGVDLLTVIGRGTYPVLGYIGTNDRIHQWNLDGSHIPIDGRGVPSLALENPLLAMG